MKGTSLDNSNEIHVEVNDEKGLTHIFRGSGAALPNGAEFTVVDGVKYKPHSHTIINHDNEVVYDRDEYGNVFIDTWHGDSPAPVPSAFAFSNIQEQSESQAIQQDITNEEDQSYGY